MKVRLKQINLPVITIPKWFQFHEGPIKTSDSINAFGANVVFQFHEGPIKTSDSINAFGANVVFQFHEGPIKTPMSLVLLTL